MGHLNIDTADHPYYERAQALMQRAKKRFKQIRPCGGHASFDTCFTADNPDRLMFWFNVGNHTRLEVEPKKED